VPMSTDITTSVLPIKRRNFNKWCYSEPVLWSFSYTLLFNMSTHCFSPSKQVQQNSTKVYTFSMPQNTRGR
jgi:hypothetical protein